MRWERDSANYITCSSNWKDWRIHSPVSRLEGVAGDDNSRFPTVAMFQHHRSQPILRALRRPLARWVSIVRELTLARARSAFEDSGLPNTITVSCPSPWGSPSPGEYKLMSCRRNGAAWWHTKADIFPGYGISWTGRSWEIRGDTGSWYTVVSGAGEGLLPTTSMFQHHARNHLVLKAHGWQFKAEHREVVRAVLDTVYLALPEPRLASVVRTVLRSLYEKSAGGPEAVTFDEASSVADSFWTLQDPYEEFDSTSCCSCESWQGEDESDIAGQFSQTNSPQRGDPRRRAAKEAIFLRDAEGQQPKHRPRKAGGTKAKGLSSHRARASRER